MKRILIVLLLGLGMAVGTMKQAQAQAWNPFARDFSYLDGYYGFTAGALASVLAAKLLGDNHDINFYQAQLGTYIDPVEDHYTLISQNVGLDKRLAPWFGVSIEGNFQQMFREDYFTVGGGLTAKYRWYALGNKTLSPYFEFENGVFQAAQAFPEGASRFTFRLAYKAGLEYTLPSEDVVRLDFGHMHHSNNGLFEPNPGYDGYGLNLVYAARFR